MNQIPSRLQRESGAVLLARSELLLNSA
jgi:hypothetical protein